MNVINETSPRLKRFVQIYNATLAERPYMEMLIRHTSMRKAELTDDERATAVRYLKSHTLNELLGPAA